MAKFEKKDGKVAWFAWSVAVSFYLYEYLVRVAPSVMEDELAIQFSASAATIATALGAYYIVYAPLQLVAGVLFDRLGGRAVLVPAATLVGIGCLLPVIPSNSLIFLTLGRIFTGIGSSFAFIGAMYLAAVWFHDNRLAFLSGLATSLGICGALAGQAPLAILIDRIGRDNSWILMSMIGFLMAVAISVFIPKTPVWEREKTKQSSTKLAFKRFISGLLSVCKNQQTWIIGLVASALYMPTVVFSDLWGIQYVQGTLGVTKAQAAEVTGLLYLGWLVGGPLAGWVSDKLQCRRKPLIIGCAVSTLLFLCLLMFDIKSAALMGLILFFAGLSSSPEVICFVASLEANKPDAKGSAIAVINMVVMFIGGIFQPIVGKLMQWGSQSGLPGEISIERFRHALLTMPILTFIGLLISFFVRKDMIEAKD